MRVFLALKFSNEDKQELHRQLLGYEKHFKSLRWVHKENYHCTLYFLGEQTNEAVDELKRSLDTYDFSYMYEPLNVSQVACFNKKDHSIVVHLPLDPPYKWLKELHADLKWIVEPYGPTTYKSYQPHITIARTKHQLHKPDYQFMENHPLVVTLNPVSLALYRSTSNEGKLIYDPIAEYPLSQKSVGE